MQGPGSFRDFVGIHEAVTRNPETDAKGGARPPARLKPPLRWMPTFEPLQPYETVHTSEPALDGHDSFHDIPVADLDHAMLRIVDTEGPVHFRVLGDRLLTAAGVSRLGSRIRERIDFHLNAPAESESLERCDDFAERWQQYLAPRFRNWAEAPEKTRDLDHIHGTELMLCLFRAVAEHERADVDTVMNDGIYAIGCIRLTQAARKRLHPPLETLLDATMLSERPTVNSCSGARRCCGNQPSPQNDHGCPRIGDPDGEANQHT